MKTSKTSKIFVYGTLKRSYWNHIRFLSDAIFLYEEAVLGFKLFQNGIPFMIRTDNPDDRVWGEVYEITELQRSSLDSLEGHPDWYRREKVSVSPDKEIVEGYVYHGYLSSNVTESKKDERGFYVF